MTMQEFFNGVYKHLMTQQCKAMDNDFCRYRSADGKKCAIGCMIPDEKYSTALECKSVDNLGNELISFGWGNLPLEFLRDLQMVHDHRFVEDWPKALKCVADKWSLTIPTEV